jgi:hypothetical protein
MAMFDSAVTPPAKVQLTKVLKHLLDDRLIHQFDPVGVGGLHCLQGGKHVRQGSHRCAIPLGRLAQPELRVVRKQIPEAAHLIFQRQRLRLEFDPVIAGDVRPHVEFGGLLDVRVAVFENDFRVAGGEAIHVPYTPAQDERMVVEPEVRGIQEHHFPDPGLEQQALVVVVDAKLLRRLRHQLAILEEDFCSRETVGLQDQLALEILDLVERMAVAVLTLLEAGNPRGLRWT